MLVGFDLHELELHRDLGGSKVALLDSKCTLFSAQLHAQNHSSENKTQLLI